MSKQPLMMSSAIKVGETFGVQRKTQKPTWSLNTKGNYRVYTKKKSDKTGKST